MWTFILISGVAAIWVSMAAAVWLHIRTVRARSRIL
jgi:hypothetical protein